ncbi:uncharacterized protein LOC113352649 [Papaver somniferum]|uniref:uncharacterized protein LOC113352649 n=1 Tax=Papaver somniferum TaxID=3469 RepID=UPI000E700696|nr:uncharacterized protein LOC113352649 [Papaver somniferum]
MFKYESESADIIFDVAHIQTPVVTRSEVLYWMEGRSRIVVYDLNNNGDTGSCRCTLIDLPDLQWGDSYMEELRYDKDHTHCLGESEGLLCYARIMRNQRTLSVWVLEDNKWCLLHKDIDLHDIFAEMSNKSYEVESEQEEQQEEDEGMNVEEEDEGMIVEEEQDGEEALMAVHVLCFNPVDKDVVFLSYNNCVWAFHTRTKRYEELSLPSFLAGMHSTYRYRIFFPFVLNPLPTILPPPSWMDTTVELS